MVTSPTSQPLSDQENHSATMPIDRADTSDQDPDGDPALINIMGRLSINPTTVPLPQSPMIDEIAQQKHAIQTNSTSTPRPSRRISAGASRKIAGNGDLDLQKKSPHPLRKMSSQTQAANPTTLSPQSKLQQLSNDSTAPISLPALSAAASTTTNDNLPMQTAASLAEEYFRKELLRHQTADVATSNTVVVIHDACYGHRYSRRKATKTQLSTIVERPERIQAVLLGVSNAYVRIGEYYTGGKSEPRQKIDTAIPLPFVIRRTTRSVLLDSTVVTNVHGIKWMQELVSMCNSAESRILSGEGELTRVQSSEEDVPKAKLHPGDLYLCRESLEALQGALGGVLDGVDEVFKTHNATGLSACKKAFVCIRPPGHHCSADMPSGFCWLNNIHVGIEHAAQAHGLTHAAIIDFDLHHGDGSQTITWQRNDKANGMPKSAPTAKRTSIGYFSLHDINSYPCEDGDMEKVQNASLCIENAHGQSIWNVHLQSWKTETEFWELYKTRYSILLDKARAYLRAQTQKIRTASVNGQPKAAIFISAGFDASEWEGEGMQRHKVNVPTDFYARFTSDINSLAEEDGTSVGGRVISVLEGGYSDRALTSSVLSHLVGLVDVPSDPIPNNPTTPDLKIASSLPSAWWSPDVLDYLENISKPTLAPATTKKLRLSEPTFHATPTESFLAKVVDRAKVHRSPAPVHTPVEIDWATATHALSKLLIPNDRQINSCRHDELNEPRIKKDRQSIMALPSTENTRERVQTRGRKPKSAEQLRASPENRVSLPIRNAPKSSRTSTSSEISGIPGDVPDITPNDIAQTVSSNQLNKAAEPVAPTNDTSIVNSNLPPARLPKPPRATVEGKKVHRTRRVSGLPPDILTKQESVSQQSFPTSLPNVEKVDCVETSIAKPNMSTFTHRAPTNDKAIENVTSGIKRITLKLSPKDDPKPPKGSSSTTTKQKAVGSKSQKLSTGKPATAQLSKVSSTPLGDPGNSSSTISGLTVEPMSENPKAQLIDPVSTSNIAQPAPIFDFEDPTPASSSCVVLPTTAKQLVTDATISEAIRGGGVGSINAELPVNIDAVPAHHMSVELQEVPKAEVVKPENLHVIKEIQIPKITHANPIPAQSSHDTHNNFIPYIVEGGLREHQTAPHNNRSANMDLTWLPPNSKTPPQSPTKQKSWDLPVFTANSHIPFGGPAKVHVADGLHFGSAQIGDNLVGGSSEGKKSPATMQDIWTVPETPKN